MRQFLVKLFISTLTLFFSAVTYAQVDKSLAKKIISQGVPSQALKDVLQFMYENRNRSFQQDTYVCAGKSEDNVRPCEETKRIKSSKTVSLGQPRFIAIVDFKKPSSQRRFYFIDLRSGEVQAYYTSHGIGSGNSEYATRFSNTKDSRQTSLGMYLTGEVYSGGYGKTLRMYGLQRSNDEAYNRDIVLHGAWYVGEDFMKSLNPKTKQPYGRVGVSWGCPAVSEYIANKIIPFLKDGSLIYHYHEDLMVQAQSGKEVRARR